MLISQVSEGNERGAGEEGVPVEDHSREYQTASELFELMTKNNFDTNDDSLTTRDLVILYKNIDVGTKLMANANEFKRKTPNQYVETIIYNEEPESDSDISEIYSNEDSYNFFTINQERINILNNQPSFENTLCHKLGGLEIQASNFTNDYDRHFLFKDPYINEQLQSLNLLADCNVGNMFPASLLDYICCKRLEDNYNFYMENIIRYVKNTIEQLKRISNGDYLTNKAKEKWNELENSYNNNINNSSKVLATSTSIPLHVERKTGGNTTTWDDIVHSEVDIRSLSKILEKKIVFEVPKLICGSYRLFSKRCVDNLFISCNTDKRLVVDKKKSEESRVDVVLQLERSQTGQVISNISSIMILQTIPTLPRDTCAAEVLPLPYKAIEDTEDDLNENKVTIIEREHDNVELDIENNIVIEEITEDLQTHDEGSIIDTNDYSYSDNDNNESLNNNSNQDSSDSSYPLREILSDKSKIIIRTEPQSLLTLDDLRLTMQRLNMQTSLPEESGEDMSTSTITKKKSPTRIRIKSPYENQSHILEEKKRKKLLEIREKREKKKMALNEHCKISKHKYAKGVIAPQASNSVTKLSITNKSFYNSIYGQAMNIDNRQLKENVRKGQKKHDTPEDSYYKIQGENGSPMLTPDKNSNKYINRSYYLDDAETEMMYMDMKQNKNKEMKDTCSASTSAVSNEFRADLTLLSQLIGQSVTDINNAISYNDKWTGIEKSVCNDDSQEIHPRHSTSSHSILNMVPVNTPTELLLSADHDKDDPKKLSSSVKCRKSIDKIYDLMKKLGKLETTECKLASDSNRFDNIGGQDGSVVQCSDSGTSLKHHLTSSNPSCFSFEKTNNAGVLIQNTTSIKNPEPVVPKVIISTKLHTLKVGGEKTKKDRKGTIATPPKIVPENPLKAISELLHEFDNVQKHRQKNVVDIKSKKAEVTFADSKSSRQGSSKRKSRIDHHLKDNDIDKFTKTFTPKERCREPRAPPVTESPKPLHQLISMEDKNVDRFPKKKMADIIDEAREARGEAVRGPSKMNSRLNTLAQPKKSYVQAHSEEYHTRYGRNLMADRLQRLAAASPPTQDKTLGFPSMRNRLKRSGSEAVSAASAKQPSHRVASLEIAARLRRSVSDSPDKAKSPAAASSKQSNVPDSPETLKKMVAVESYVKSYYGRASAPMVPGEQSAHKSRVPLLPKDIELASMASSPTAEKSTELGSKLHRIIDSIIINTNPKPYSKISKDNTDDFSITDNLSRGEEHASLDSDYNVDVFQDKNVLTAVKSVDEAKNKEDIVKKDVKDNADPLKCYIKPFNSSMELQKLENALYSHISLGAFQKRLRIKNLTLTPKQSIQEVFLLQSGDAGSLVLKSSLSQSLKINKSVAEHIHDKKSLPVISNTKMNWNFADLPMQIATVGYAFQKYQSVQCGPSTIGKSLDPQCGNTFDDRSLKNSKIDKISQCFKDHQRLERETQAAIQDFSPIISNKQSNIYINDIAPVVQKEQIDGIKNTNESSGYKEKTVQVTGIHENENIIEKKPSTDDVDLTSSLDMLVALLNEIQKITKCPTNFTENDQNKRLKMILNNAAALEDSSKSSPLDLVSITSLDKLRQLESNPSIYSLYLSNDDDLVMTEKVNFIVDEKISGNNSNLCDKPFFNDKGVSVDFVESRYVNRFTDVPSRFFPVNHSTNITNSLIGVISVPSSQSMFSFTEYQTLYSNESIQPHKNIIDLLDTPRVTDVSQLTVMPKLFEEIKLENNENLPKIEFTSDIEEGVAVKTTNEMLVASKYWMSSLDMDPMMKIKRDILVTVYSLLVFTVFAALSFPEVLYNV